MAGQIICPLKSNKMARYTASVSVSQCIAHVKRHQLALLILQAAEWGMGAMQGMCGHLHCLSSNNASLLELLELCSDYFNFCTRAVGYNQIRTVKNP